MGVDKPHSQKSNFFKKPDFSTPASFRFNCAYLLSQSFNNYSNANESDRNADGKHSLIANRFSNKATNPASDRAALVGCDRSVGY